MSKKIEIDGISFQTQKAAIDYTRDVLVSCESVGLVSEASPVEWRYLNALVLRHPEYLSKKGVGIKAFIISRKYGNIVLDLLCLDGSVKDISWIYCVKSTHATPYQNLISAMRLAVKPQVQSFKRSAVNVDVVCGICLKPIVSFAESHVDHASPTFLELSEWFLSEVDSAAPIEFVDHPVLHQSTFSEVDSEFSRKWQDYHLENAQLRLVHAKCNLSRKRQPI